MEAVELFSPFRCNFGKGPYVCQVNEQQHAMTYHSYPSKFVTWFRQTYGVRHPELAVRKLNAMTIEQLSAAQVAYRAAIAK